MTIPMRAAGIPVRPTWPFRSETILTPDGNGQWSKKYRGKKHYFGPWADPEAALIRWRREWPMIVAGLSRATAATGGASTVREVCGQFMTAKKTLHENGSLAWPTFAGYRHITRQIVAHLGANTSTADLSPRDFLRLLGAWKHISPVKRGTMVTQVRVVFGWAVRNMGIEPVRFGSDFRGPPAKVRRQAAQERARRIVTPQMFRSILSLADPVMSAICWLGVNGGYGATDAAELPVSAIDFARSMIDYHRHKTGAIRVVPLWPETIEALQAVIDPARETVFANRAGGKLVRPGTNEITRRFKVLADAAGVPCTHQWFRTTFSTIATETGDDHARNIIMGHTIDGVPEGYVQRFPESRLWRVANHVRAYILGEPQNPNSE